MEVHPRKRKERRTVLKALWALLGITALLEFLLMVFAYLAPGNRTQKKNSSPKITAGPANRFENGSVTAFRQGRFYLVRLEDGGFLALSSKCTHLGCSVPWVAQDNCFRCPCHASEFDITGAVRQAPAPRPLDLFAVSVENEIVRVDTARRIKRDRFDTGQVVYL